MDAKYYFYLKLKGAEKYCGNFECKEDVVREFAIQDDDLRDAFILLAWYGYGDYDGSAFVLFERGGKLYEVNGGHCSCYGLEECWDPEETDAQALLHRIEHGRLGQDSYYDECTFGDYLKKLLERW